MREKLGVQDSNAIYIARGLAMLSVIAAHVNVMNDKGFLEEVVTSSIAYFGQIGVIIFFITGGFLYLRQENDNKIYCCKKVQTLILPWLFCSSATYFLSILFRKEGSITGYLKWILGSGTWYYYIVIYIICLFLFKWIWKSTKLCIACVIITIVSLWLNGKSLDGYLKCVFLTPYLNILNWIGFFAIGVLLKRFLNTLKLNFKELLIALLCVIFGYIGLRHLDIYSYFSIYSFFFELGGGLTLICFCYCLDKSIFKKILMFSGRNSYCIYLLHMQIVQFVCNKIPDNVILDILRPILGLIIMDVLIIIVYKLAEKFKRINCLIALIGLRPLKERKSCSGVKN